MIRFIAISVIGGLLFGTMDGLINANPLAIKLFEIYKPIARISVNVTAGIAIDLIYGFILAGLFLKLYRGIPGRTGVIKGLFYGLIVWFFRVAMGTVSNWMMFNVPDMSLLYALLSGLCEMLILGLFYGCTLKAPDSGNQG